MLVNSCIPDSGSIKYLFAFPVAGFGNDNIFASKDRFCGNIKSIGGFVLLGGNDATHSDDSSDLVAGDLVCLVVLVLIVSPNTMLE